MYIESMNLYITESIGFSVSGITRMVTNRLSSSGKLRHYHIAPYVMSPELTSAAPQLLSDQDLYLFNEGSNYRIHEKMGAHLITHNGVAGCVFSVWAPNARSLSVVGSFNDSKVSI